MSTQTRFNRSKYRDASRLFNELRSQGPAFRNVVKYNDSVRTWKPSDYDDERDFAGGHKHGYKDIEKLSNMLGNTHIGAMSALNEQVFGVSYMIHGDIDRLAVLGENTYGMRGEMEWTNLLCEVRTYSGVARYLPSSESTQNLLVTGVNDRKKIQQATGWDVPSTQGMTADDMNSLGNLLRSSSSGHNKYTRLVKGFLLYIDLLSHGRQHFVANMANVLEYNQRAVIGSFRAEDRSYSYCSKPTSQAYIAMLYMIGLGYPFNYGGIVSYGSCTVPPDSGNHFVVINGVRISNDYDTFLTAELVWTGLVCYSSEMGISDQLESALITACSLYDNRYMSKASLPRVDSVIDLIRPAFVERNIDESSRPMLNVAMTRVVGRVHQMSVFLMIKDVIMSSKMSTDPGLNYSRLVRQYLMGQESILTRMSEWVAPVAILSASKELRWAGDIGDADIDDIDSMSILEALWLCNHETKSIARGGIEMLFNGIKDMERTSVYMDVLMEETNKFGIVLDRNRVPTGIFSVKGRCVYNPVEWEPDVREFESFTSVLVQECDYGKKPVERKVVRKQRYSKQLRKKSDDDVSHYTTESEDKPRESVTEEEVRERVHKRVVGEHTARLGKIEEELSKSLVGVRVIPTRHKKEVTQGSKKIVDLRHESLGKVESGKSLLSSKDEEIGIYGNPEANRHKIVWGERPLISTNVEIWERIRKEAILSGVNLEPVTDWEKARAEGINYTGMVNIEWDTDVLEKVRDSQGWENTLKNRGLDLSKRIFGDTKEFYLIYLASMTGSWEYIKMVNDKFDGTTVNLNPETLHEASKEIDIETLSARPRIASDSATQSKRVDNDGYILELALKLPFVRDRLSSTAIKSLINTFKTNKYERASIRRTVET